LFRLFECCALSFFERFVLSFSLKIERFVSDSAEIWICGLYKDRAAWNYLNNDFMLQNNRYIRLKSLVIGYTLPRVWTLKAKMEKVRVYFSGNDLWEATSIKDGFDPEMGEMAQNTGYPFARTWSFGVNVTF